MTIYCPKCGTRLGIEADNTGIYCPICNYQIPNANPDNKMEISNENVSEQEEIVFEENVSDTVMEADSSSEPKEGNLFVDFISSKDKVTMTISMEEVKKNRFFTSSYLVNGDKKTFNLFVKGVYLIKICIGKRKLSALMRLICLCPLLSGALYVHFFRS